MTGYDRQGCLASLISLVTGRGRRGQDDVPWRTFVPSVDGDGDSGDGDAIPLAPPVAESVPARLPYRLHDEFLSPAELSFYRVLLLLAIRGEVTVSTKVNLQDIFFTSCPHENQAFQNKISAKHLDFLVCQPGTMRPILGIELDDVSHRNPARQERDAFVDSVFATAGLPLLRFPVRNAYDVRALSEAVGRHTGMPADSAVADAGTPLPAETRASPPVCPKCGIPMVMRTASRGENQGKPFYGCLNYPRCREIQRAPA